MSLYYRWVCPSKSQRLDPGDHYLNLKEPFPSIGFLAMLEAAIKGPWLGCAVYCVDEHHEFYDASYEWPEPAGIGQCDNKEECERCHPVLLRRMNRPESRHELLARMARK